MNLADFTRLLEDVHYPHGKLKILNDGIDLFLQYSRVAPCCNTGEPQEQKGRKWYLSPYMCKSEFVATCLKAILTFEEHEIREHFTYRGKRVFGPHMDVEALVVAAEKTDKRD